MGFMLVGGVVAVLTMGVVMVGVVVVFFLEKVRVDVEFGVQVEAAQVKHLRQGHVPKMHGPLRRPGVHVFQAVHQGVHLVFGHQVGLADEDLVGKPHLAAGFLAVVELLGGMFGIHQRQDRVQQVTLRNLLVHKKGLRHRAGVGQAGGFDHHTLEVQQAFAPFGGQQLQRFTQIFADRAANAAITHLHDLLWCIGHQNVVVDVFFTKLVLDHGNFLAMAFGQHTFEQGGFTRTQKAGEDGDRDEAHGMSRKSEAGKFSGVFQHTPRRGMGCGVATHDNNQSLSPGLALARGCAASYTLARC